MIEEAAEVSENIPIQETEDQSAIGNHVLVACFSATGHTMPLAEYAADILDADLYEIVAADPYTEADLAYYTGGRCDQEQDDPDVRPEIAGDVLHMDQYDTILIGHPIWHGQAPRIISTFLESYDFSGKTLTTFCTSESSGLGSSAENLHSLVPDDVTWLESRRFEIETGRKEVGSWLDEIGLGGQGQGGAVSEMKIQITISGHSRIATLCDNLSGSAFYELLLEGPVTIDMHDYGGFEKVGSLGTDLVTTDQEITTKPGDIILYQGNQITIYYDENSWNFTLLGHVDGATGENMREFLGDGDPKVTFSIAE